MAFDGIVTAAMTNELASSITGAKIEKIYQPEADELVFFVHTGSKRLKIYASSSSEHPGIYITNDDFANPKTPPAFCMLMRKHLQAARISHISQIGSERIIEISFETRDEMGFAITKKLICEIMGRHSNIILVNANDHRIIDALKRVSLDESRARQILPGGTYEYPPSQNKKPIVDCDDAMIKSIMASARETDKALLDNISGISPVISRMIGSATDPHEANMMLQSIWRASNEGAFSAIVYIDAGTPKDFHIIRIPEYDARYESMSFDSLSDAIAYFYSGRSQSNRIKQKAQSLSRTVSQAIKKHHLKIQRLSEELMVASASEDLRLYGELITANIHKIKTGDSEVTLTNYYDGEPVTIPLDVRYAPAKNAQMYFKKYQKSKTAVVEKKKQLANANDDITYLESVYSFIERAESIDEIEAIKTELADAGFVRTKKQKETTKQKNDFYSYTSPSGLRILAGRNNKENDLLTLKKADRNDIWMHTKDIPGSHVIIFTEAGEPTEADLFVAANIAAWHSKARGSENVPVDYTRVKHVRKPASARPGMVIFTDNRTLYVTPKDPTEK